MSGYPIQTTKGQLLFLQHMVLSVVPGGLVCTVIDDGALNNNDAAATRRWIGDNARIKSVVSLPAVTFKPNKISVKSSVLLLERFDLKNEDPEEGYSITFVELKSLGFHASGELIRNFDFDKLRREFGRLMAEPLTEAVTGEHFRAFPVSSHEIAGDSGFRLDCKFWDAEVRDRIKEMRERGGRTLGELNTITTDRGVSPKATSYVDAEDGYAMVIKAGSSITPFGQVIDSGDYLEKYKF
ncbi:N-6 DNA methylase, partial [Nocardia gipuzkoensis]